MASLAPARAGPIERGWRRRGIGRPRSVAGMMLDCRICRHDTMTTDTESGLAEAMSRLLARHRSIRKFKDVDIPPALVDEVCRLAIAGSSSSGNLNMIAIVRSRNARRRERLCELHFGQTMVLQAPLVLTFCADSHRTRSWLAQRGARLNFGNLISYHVAAFDAIIVAQTAALAFESHGLGICYMGTTLHSMRGIAELLELPDHCVPVTSMVVGVPDEAPDARDRLPLAAYVHDEVYRRHDAAAIDALYAQRERKGWERYRTLMPETFERMQAEGIDSLARFYTSDHKYPPDRFADDSIELRGFLESRGFMP